MAANYYTREYENKPTDVSLSFDGTNFLIRNGGVQIPVPITTIRGLDGQLYANAESMQGEHILLNALDSIKDGANKHTVIGLNVYNCKSLPQYDTNISFPSKLHEIEGSIIDANKDFITVNAVTKTKKGKQTAYVINGVHNWFKESGLHPSYLDAIFQDAKIITSIATKLDPLEKNIGTVFPALGRSLGIYTSAMNQFGCPNTSIISTTINGDDGGNFEYSVRTGCGEGCYVPRSCDITQANGDDYTGGNASKNAKINKTVGARDKTAEKTKLIVVKELGDKSQVIVNFIYKHIHHGRRCIMITCDMVVFIFCIMLNLECIYTGPYKDIGYATVHFRPGSMLAKTRSDAISTLRKIHTENQFILQNMIDLYQNPDTPVMLGGQDKTFNKLFYGAIVKDIMLLQHGLQLEIYLRDKSVNYDHDVPSLEETLAATLASFEGGLGRNRTDDIITDARGYFSEVLINYTGIAPNYSNPGENENTIKIYIKTINDDVKRITNQYTIIPPITKRGNKLQMKLSGYYTIDKSNPVSATKPGFKSFGDYYSETRPLHSYAVHPLSRSGGGRRRSQRGGAIRLEQFQEDDFNAVGNLDPDPIPFVVDHRPYDEHNRNVDDDNVFKEDDLIFNGDLNKIKIVPMFREACTEFMQTTYPNNSAYHSFKEDVIHTLWTLLMYEYMRIGGTHLDKMPTYLEKLYREYIDPGSIIMGISDLQQSSRGQSTATASAASIPNVRQLNMVSSASMMTDIEPIHLTVDVHNMYNISGEHVNRATAAAAATPVAAAAAAARNENMGGGKKRRTKRSKRTRKTKKNRR